MSQCVRICASAIAVFMWASAPAVAQHKPRPTLEQRISALEAIVGAQAEQMDQLRDRIHVLRDRLLAMERVIEDHRAKLACMSMVGDNVFFTGCNVNIVNGMGATATTNALGNLIVGYNEGDDAFPRTGSHNLVVGPHHSWSSYGGFVAGFQNWIRGKHATVSGGTMNLAGGTWTSISGGLENATGDSASSVSGGRDNTANGPFSSVSGGSTNNAQGSSSSVTGGVGNLARGPSSSVSGGRLRVAPNDSNWAAGSLLENE
jgi:hypothetical protein